MASETRVVLMEPGIRLGVRCFVQGIIQRRWERLEAETKLPKAELEQIGSQFHERQVAYGEWRWHKAEQFAKDGDMAAAEEWRQNRCLVCDEPLLVSSGQLICPCYRGHGIGFIQYAPVDPALHLKQWKELGGTWGPHNKLIGDAEARLYAERTCYTNDCNICGEPFFVTIGEMLKVTKVIVADPNAGGDGRYRVRRVCPDCKNGQKAVYADRARNGKRSTIEVKQLRAAANSPTPARRAGGEKGSE